MHAKVAAWNQVEDCEECEGESRVEHSLGDIWPAQLRQVSVVRWKMPFSTEMACCLFIENWLDEVVQCA